MRKMNYATVGLVLSLIDEEATRIAQEYESVGIIGASFNPTSGILTFTLTDNSQLDVSLGLSAQGVSFSSSNGIISTNVQNALDEIQENINSAIANEYVKTFTDESIITVSLSTNDLMGSIVEKDYAEGTILLGSVSLSDMPTGLQSAGLMAELKSIEADSQIWHLTLTSDSVSPYMWTREYNSSNLYIDGNNWDTRILGGEFNTLRETVNEIWAREVVQLTGEEMLEALTSDGYLEGQIAICKDDTSYFQGHIYRFEILPDTTYTWIDISVQKSLTNSQMETALTTKLFVNGEVFICSDSGTYTQGGIFKYNATTDNPSVLSWIDITPTSPSKATTYTTTFSTNALDYNTVSGKYVLTKTIQGLKTYDAYILENNDMFINYCNGIVSIPSDSSLTFTLDNMPTVPTTITYTIIHCKNGGQI